MRARGALRVRIVVGAVAVCCLVVLVALFWPLPDALGWHGYVDITAGRYRRKWYVLWILVADRIEETDFSRVYRDVLGEPPDPVWRHESYRAYGPLRKLGHPRYYCAAHTASDLVSCFNETPFAKMARREAVMVFLRLLQVHGDDELAGEYVRRMERMVAEWAPHAQARGPVTVEDLPPAPPPGFFRGGHEPWQPLRREWNQT